MSDAIIAAIISGVVTLAGVIVSNSRAQAVTDTKIDELTREVREHNNFAKRVPLLEQQMETVQENIEELQSLHKRQ